jgi:DNA-binding NarL/FixJ family response regulator
MTHPNLEDRRIEKLIAETNFYTVDDHQIVNFGIRILLETMGAEKIREFRSFEDFRSSINPATTGFAILDLELDQELMVDNIALLLSQVKAMKVVVYSRHDMPFLVHRILQLGVHGYVCKISGMMELKFAIKEILTGGSYVDIKLKQTLENFESSVHAIRTLSKKEMEVFLLLAKGQRYKEIADTMNISTNAVGTYRTRIGNKLNANSILDLEHIALANNLI